MDKPQTHREMKNTIDALTLENKILYRIVGNDRDLVERALSEALDCGANKVVSLLQDVLRPLPKEDAENANIPIFLQRQAG